MVRCRKLAAACIGLCIINYCQAFSLYFPSNDNPSKYDLRLISLVQMNVWGGRNRDYDRAVKAIRENNPDIVGVSEVTQGWINALRAALPDYPFVIADPHYGGVALFSRFPLIDPQVKHFGKIMRPRIQSQVKIGDQEITIIFVHTVTPVKKAGLSFRNRELMQIAEDVRACSNPVIVAGDLNCSPWSSYFSDFIHNAGLHDTEQGFGAQCSWNAWYPVPFIPIDHCLISNDFVTLQRHVGSRTGSDHLPVYVQIGLKTSHR
jgi:endonuclease/exonuclease/phosphatase (EEP) superfamily protein YafD